MGSACFRRCRSVIASSPWTIALTLLLVVANLGLADGAPDATSRMLDWLQYDRAAILDGQVWRIVTGHLVHWSVEHAALDIGAFFLVGLLYERPIREMASRSRRTMATSSVGRLVYPGVLVLSALGVSLALFALRPELATYRGFSGLNSAQFAALLVCEWRSARREPLRWLTAGVATVIFATKIVMECATGEMFFGTESLGDLGQPIPLAHAAGSVMGLAAMLAAGWTTAVLSYTRDSRIAPVRRSCSS